MPELLSGPQRWEYNQLRQVGILLEYLAYHRADTRPQETGGWPLAEYLRKALSGQPVEGDPVHALLTTGLNELDAELLGFEFPESR